MTGSLLSRLQDLPRPFDAATGARTGDALGLSGVAYELVAAAAGSSPFLARLMERDPGFTRAVLERSPEESMRAANEAAFAAAREQGAPAQMKALRLAKRDAALASALAEIGGVWPTMEAAAHYSRFADAAVRSALRMAFGDVRRLGFAPADENDVEHRCGITVLAMGKHGAFELNYSSDIDLVILFDSASENLGVENAKRVAVAAARSLVSRLNDQTADGYVFRTDLRLRPDPGVSAAAVSVNAAEAYYEAHGQNWERAAYIKARAAAGDIPLGEEFLKRLTPFIWRRSLDFAAIDDVHALLRQIHDSQGRDATDFFGFDLKRGAGGIRSVEFFAQAQQLLGGGKNPALRVKGTLEALSAMAASGVVSGGNAEALASRYCYLRKVENRLQMIGDEQTHKVPANEDDMRRLARFLGDPGPDAFRARLSETISDVRRLTSALFATETPAAEKAQPFIFTGVDNDPETIKALKAMGFERPEQVAGTIRRWNAGETRATRTPRARSLLQRTTGPLLDALARASAPDDAFAAFDSFLRSLPAGVQIFSLFLNRPDVFDRLIRIMTMSPYLANLCGKRPALVEALLESRWPEPPQSVDKLSNRLAERLSGNDGYEAALNIVRRWTSEQNFSVAAQLVVEALAPADAAARFSNIADASIEALFAIAAAETERLLGAFDGEVAIIAQGRLGARTMTATSDIDLMFIYDCKEELRLEAAAYFGKFVRRFLAAVTTPTEEGVVYDVDMKLRPSGAKGPAAVSMTAFTHYYVESAWTWEKMALTKARIVAGSPGLGARIESEIAKIIRTPRDAAATARDVDEMRERLKEAKPPVSVWDLKYAVGGLTDLDFIVQYLTLANAPHLASLALAPSTLAMLPALEAAGVVSADDTARLAEAGALFEAIVQMSRAAAGGVFAPGGAGEALRRAMAGLAGAASISDAQQRLEAVEGEVRAIYEKIVQTAARGA